jgi:hypothetical protein
MLRTSALAMMAVLFALSGCKLTGGGFVPSAYLMGEVGTYYTTWGGIPEDDQKPSAKAHFGFNAECVVDFSYYGPELESSGNLQFSDNGSWITVDAKQYAVRLHGRIRDVRLRDSPVDPCAIFKGYDTYYGVFEGKYDAQPKKLGYGKFIITVSDGGEPGPSEDDYFEIEVVSGPFGGYSNGGYIQGGNIQQHF